MKRSILTTALVVAMGIGLAVPVGAAEPPPKRVIYVSDQTDDTTWNVKRAVYQWNRNDYVKIYRVATCVGYHPCATIIDKYQEDYWYQWYPEYLTYAGIFFYETRNIELYTWPMLRPELTGRDAYARQIWRNYVSCHEIGHYVLENVDVHRHWAPWKHTCMTVGFSGYDYPGVALKKVR